MDIDVNGVIDRLAQQVAALVKERAILQTQVATLQQAVAERDGGAEQDS